jgi:hypothetical protein
MITCERSACGACSKRLKPKHPTAEQSGKCGLNCDISGSLIRFDTLRNEGIAFQTTFIPAALDQPLNIQIDARCIAKRPQPGWDAWAKEYAGL